MVKYFSLTFILTCLLLNVQSQKINTAPTADAAHEARLANALLWKISHSDLEVDSYLYGTIHMIAAEDYFLPPGTEQAIARADKIMFEIDLEEMMNPMSLMTILPRTMMPNGMTLEDLLNAEDYQVVKAFMADMGLPAFMATMMERIKPLFLSAMVGTDMSPDGMSSGAIKSYEMEFYELAKVDDKPIGGLETMQFQLSIFDSIPYADQAQMLVESIKGADAGSEELDKLVELYKSQDVDGMSEIMDSEEVGAGEFEDILVNQRNENWIPLMADEMKNGVVFFAVGAGHLGGEHGVIRLLRKEGYRVTPVVGDAGRPVRKF